MANIFITGSADGLGQLTAKALVKAGHRVVLHARNEERGRQALAAVPGLGNILDANKSSIDQFTYSDTKLHDLILALAVARKWPHVCTNAVDPGWVPTKMGGSAAPDNLQKGFETQVWLAASEEPDALSSGHYYHHKKQFNYLKAASNSDVQENLLALCKQVTGISFPAAAKV